MARKYSNEFKVMIEELLQSGQSVSSVSKEYSLNGSMIRKWRKFYEHSVDFREKLVLTEDQKHIKLLERELRNIKLERDILKKAVSIFSASDR